jgi:hypothetical protein
MASKYLNLYSGAGGLRQRNILGMSSPYQRPQFSFGTPQNVFYQSGAVTKVVHDTLNNRFYGQAKQSDVIKGLQDSIKRVQGQLGRRGETSYTTGWMGSLNSTYRNYSAKDRVEQRARLKKQQGYLKHVQSGGYSQGPHGNKFFESYDAHTSAYNNIYQRTYNNKIQGQRNARIRTENARKQREHAAAVERNRLQDIENAKIQRRNQKIAGEEEATTQGSNNTAQSTKNKSRAKPLKPNLTVGTGIASGAYRGLGDTGLSL